jgi:hypothetical protein
VVKPKNFDPNKKYPIVFMVYGEPGSQTVTDNFYTGWNGLYVGDMAADGYIYVSLENRGTPAPKDENGENLFTIKSVSLIFVTRQWVLKLYLQNGHI